jgi:hypothetical protein
LETSRRDSSEVYQSIAGVDFLRLRNRQQMDLQSRIHFASPVNVALRASSLANSFWSSWIHTFYDRAHFLYLMEGRAVIDVIDSACNGITVNSMASGVLKKRTAAVLESPIVFELFARAVRCCAVAQHFDYRRRVACRIGGLKASFGWDRSGSIVAIAGFRSGTYSETR